MQENDKKIFSIILTLFIQMELLNSEVEFAETTIGKYS